MPKIGCIEQYKIVDQESLHVKNLPTNVVSAVFKPKWCPRFIGTFTVVTEKGQAYTLSLSRNLNTHTMLSDGMLKLYVDSRYVNVETLVSKGSVLSQAIPFISEGQADPPLKMLLFQCPQPRLHRFKRALSLYKVSRGHSLSLVNSACTCADTLTSDNLDR